jgi:Rrf2 family iron-sulfur cluster assembly transcriptional regulator
MKINSTFEQGIYVVIILALEKDHAPVKSKVMSELLQVSDSYLKKILGKMSGNGLVISSANKQGGYQLSRRADEISIRDVYEALELNLDTFKSSHFAEKLFPDKKHVRDSEKIIEDTINRGLGKFYKELEKMKVSDLLEDGKYQNGAIVWEDRVSGSRQGKKESEKR